MWKFILIFVLCASAYSKKSISKNSKTLTTFAGDLYQKSVEGETGNVIISPTSIRSVLTMAMFGATTGSLTKNEMMRGLKYPHSHTNQKIAETYEKLVQTVGENNDVKIANKVFIMQKLTIKPTFQDLISKSFKSKAVTIDFNKNHEAAGIINKWVESQTDNMITNLISPDSLNNETRMVLVNSVFFKGIWQYKFEALNFRNLPYKEPFYLTETKFVDIEVMKLKENLFYGEFDDLDVQALRLPYKNSGVAMLVLLPRKRTGLADLERKLTNFNIRDKWKLMERTMVDVSMPKFKIEFEIDMQEPLKKMGMNRMFSDKAEFSNLINGKEPLKISKVIHKSVIEVDEEGSKAASGSAGIVVVSRMFVEEVEEKEKNFYADHPFLFFLIERKTSQILFIGRVAKF